MRTLQRHGVPVAVRVTIHRHNVGDLENIARLLLEELGLPSFGTNAAGYLGTVAGTRTMCCSTAGRRAAGHGDPAAPDRQYPGRISANAGPLAEARIWRRDGGGARPEGAPAFRTAAT